MNPSLEHLRPGGFYFIEDIRNLDFGFWKERLPSYANRFPNCDFALAAVTNPFNHYDNNLLVIQKQA